MPDYEQICVLIVTFFPDECTLKNIRRIEELWPALQIVVVDNTTTTEASCDQDFFNSLCQYHPRVFTIRNHVNLGIATALNQGAEYAIQRGFQWLVTLDQDTEVDSDYFFEVNKILCNFSIPSRIAVIGVNYHNLVAGKVGEPIKNDTEFAEVKDVISSGSLVSLTVFRKIGGFSDKLFIDMVDTEYCFRARRHGYNILFVNKPLIWHSLGFKETFSLVGFSLNFANHSPFRHYFIFRNTIYMVKQYMGSDFVWGIKMVCKYLPKVFLKALLGKARRESLKNIIHGIRDGVISSFPTGLPPKN